MEVDFKPGDYVVYINTGTKGRVVDIKEIDGEIWVLLDNDLLYKPYLLRKIDKIKREEKKKEEIKIEEEEESLDIEDFGDACGAG
ncbi:DUF2098 family protein [Methanocaldococcus indicus]|uniref:DUF2098 family protein n=1 Tax=Methanocaldococcus indicus TaxID=213231 RepID=UPI003C6D9F77